MLARVAASGWLVALSLAGCADNPIAAGVPRIVDKHVMTPYAMHEECMRLERGDRLDWRYDSSAPLSFNIHYHEGDAVLAPVVKDAWTSANNVVLGAAWLVRTTPEKVEAFSAVCPHLGCAIGWENDGFLCPCHESRFAATGEKQTGPSERGLDPLPVAIQGDRLQLTWIRYKLGQSSREPI